MTSLKQNASGQGGAKVDLADRLESTKENSHPESSTNSDVLASTATTVDVQLAKVLALLLSGPKTTIDLRSHAIMMPAARVFQLKYEQGYVIRTERVSLFDAEGIRHRMCARYHLDMEASRKQQLQGTLDLGAPA
jgi:hypothetical protein